MSKETQKQLKPGELGLGLCSSCKVHEKCVEDFLPFRQILSALQTSTYKLAKFLVPISESLTTNKYTVKDLFFCHSNC